MDGEYLVVAEEVTEQEAREAHRAFFDEFPQLERWMADHGW